MFDYERRAGLTADLSMVHRLEVVVAVASPNLLTPGDTRWLVLADPDKPLTLPHCGVEAGETTLETAARVLKDVANLRARIGSSNFGWPELALLGLMDNVNRTVEGRRQLAVAYLTMIPEAVPVTDSERTRWLATSEIMGRRPLFMDHWEILLLAGNKL